jgi:nucleoside-diphosphate-sugar epimerase
MKALVTGATGFVGACLARRLVQDGNNVHLFTRRESNRWRIDDLLPHVSEHLVDLRDAASVADVVGRIRPEVIFHLATYGGFAFQQETQAIFDANFFGTVNLVKACEKTDFASFINTGSSSEYGLKAVPMREDAIPEPVGDYGVSKVAATLYCRSKAISTNLPIVTLRLFSPYGPWDDQKRLIPYVLASLLRGEPPQLSNPAAVRDYVYVDDVVEAYLQAARKMSPPGEIYNVGSGRQYSIAEIVEILCKLVAKGMPPVWGAREMQRPEPVTWAADINKILSALGWKPTVTLSQGLALTADWLREHLECY